MIFLLVPRKFTCLLTALIFLTILLSYNLCYAQKGEETYDISLIKTADPGSAGEIHEVDGKKVLAETYTVKDGDHLWQLLRERELLEKKNLAELLSVLKRLNGSLDNLDMIRPGETIIIPLAISPSAGGSSSPNAAPTETIPLESIKNIDLEEYVVNQGDSIIKIVEDLYDIPQKELYNEYLSSLKQLNPDIKDLNTVYPGQKIRIPIYSPKVVRLPIEKSKPASEPMTEAQKEGIKVIAGQVGEIFGLMGEQWLQTGEHFFPLKTGGQLKLNAESYPIVELRSGKKVIVDIYNEMPERMGGLIKSNWDNYEIVHLESNDDLKEAFDRIISVCEYKKVYGPGEPFVITDEIPLRITADRIIEQAQAPSAEGKRITVINFSDEGSYRTPDTIIKYLALSGVKVIDYPLLKNAAEIKYNEADVMDVKDTGHSLVETLLDITGQNYSTDMELPVYKNEKGDFDLVIKADFFFNINGRDHIIDLSGLGKDIINLLKEHQFMVYSISDKKTSSDIVTGMLDFLGIKYEARPHQFLSTSGPDTKNIILNIQGISFKDKGSVNIFATPLRLPQELIIFLNMNGYRMLQLPVTISASGG